MVYQLVLTQRQRKSLQILHPRVCSPDIHNKASTDGSLPVVSTLQAGCFFGALIAYYVADRWGRRVSVYDFAKGIS